VGTLARQGYRFEGWKPRPATADEGGGASSYPGARHTHLRRMAVDVKEGILARRNPSSANQLWLFRCV
jgi:hypothetical protein